MDEDWEETIFVITFVPNRSRDEYKDPPCP